MIDTLSFGQVAKLKVFPEQVDWDSRQLSSHLRVTTPGSYMRLSGTARRRRYRSYFCEGQRRFQNFATAFPLAWSSCHTVIGRCGQALGQRRRQQVVYQSPGPRSREARLPGHYRSRQENRQVRPQATIHRQGERAAEQGGDRRGETDGVPSTRKLWAAVPSSPLASTNSYLTDFFQAQFQPNPYRKFWHERKSRGRGKMAGFLCNGKGGQQKLNSNLQVQLTSLCRPRFWGCHAWVLAAYKRKFRLAAADDPTRQAIIDTRGSHTLSGTVIAAQLAIACNFPDKRRIDRRGRWLDLSVPGQSRTQ